MKTRKQKVKIAHRDDRDDTYTHNVGYKEICAHAAVYDNVFGNFKSFRLYQKMLEHADARQAYDHLIAISKQTPELLIEYLDKFKTNDSVGTPDLVEMGDVGKISATTIQYIRVLSDLIMYFGNMNGIKIVEIGAGYGGQCKIISDYVKFEEYICFEMTEPSQLVRRYVDHFKIKNVSSLDAYEFFDNPYEIKCDLVISNFAFSEQSKHFQDCYLKNIINLADRGYLWMNETSETYGIKGIKNILPHTINVKLDIPSERHTNRILTWG